MFTRSAEIVLEPQFVDVYEGFPNKHVADAIGYLVNWAIGSERYHKVKVYGDRHGDLTATYYDKNNNITYVIGAVQHEDNSPFSFHS